MRDKPLFILLRQTLIAGLVARGLTDVLVTQAFQPTQQGQPSARTVYFSKAFEHAHGSPKSSSIYDGTGRVLKRNDKQIIESTYTFGATVTENITDMSALTVSDLLKIARAIVQTTDFQQTLIENDVGILRVLDIREPKIRSDRDQFKTEPTFDLIVSHRDTYTVAVPGIDVFTADIIPI